MAGLAAAIEYLIGLVSGLLSIALGIRSATQKSAQENSPFEIDTATQELLSLLNDSTWSNQAIRNTIDTNAALATAQYDDLVARIALVQQTGAPVTLPSAPTGYGGAPVGETADAVWLATLPTSNVTADWALSNVFLSHTVSDGYAAQHWAFGEFFTFNTDPLNFNEFGLNGGFFPSLDYSLLTADMTVHDWLVASMPGTTWVLDFATDHYIWRAASPAICTMTCTLDPGRLYEIKLGLGLIAKASSSPLWPGLANVTLGSPVALSTGLTLDGPMDGVIVSLTSVPVQRGHYTYDDLEVYLNVGGLVFVDDNGDGEFFQSMGAVDGVYVPKTMEHAASCKVRAAAGVAGTITPWTIS